MFVHFPFGQTTFKLKENSSHKEFLTYVYLAATAKVMNYAKFFGKRASDMLEINDQDRCRLNFGMNAIIYLNRLNVNYSCNIISKDDTFILNARCLSYDTSLMFYDTSQLILTPTEHFPDFY